MPSSVTTLSLPMVEMFEPLQVSDFRGQLYQNVKDPRAAERLLGRDIAIKKRPRF